MHLSHTADGGAYSFLRINVTAEGPDPNGAPPGVEVHMDVYDASGASPPYNEWAFLSDWFSGQAMPVQIEPQSGFPGANFAQMVMAARTSEFPPVINAFASIADPQAVDLCNLDIWATSAPPASARNVGVTYGVDFAEYEAFGPNDVSTMDTDYRSLAGRLTTNQIMVVPTLPWNPDAIGTRELRHGERHDQQPVLQPAERHRDLPRPGPLDDFQRAR